MNPKVGEVWLVDSNFIWGYGEAIRISEVVFSKKRLYKKIREIRRKK